MNEKKELPWSEEDDGPRLNKPSKELADALNFPDLLNPLPLLSPLLGCLLSDGGGGITRPVAEIINSGSESLALLDDSALVRNGFTFTKSR